MEGERWKVVGKIKLTAAVFTQHLEQKCKHSTSNDREAEKKMFGAVFLAAILPHRDATTKRETDPPNVYPQCRISTIRVESTLIVFHCCSANRPNPGKCSAKSLVHLPSGCTQGQETQYFQTRCTTAGQLQRDSRGVCGSLVSVPCHSEGYTCHRDRRCVYGGRFSSSKAVCCPVVRPSPLDHKHVPLGSKHRLTKKTCTSRI